MTGAEQVLGRADAEGRRAAAWLRDLITGRFPDLVERPRQGWGSLNYHHPSAGYVCGIFPRRGEAALVVEHGAALGPVREVFDQVGAQVGTVVIREVPDPRAARIVDAVAAEIGLRAG